AQESSPAPVTSTKIEAAKSFDPVEATKAWLNTVPADKRAKSDAYFEGGYWLILWNFLLGAAVGILLLASKWSARLRDFAERATKSWWLWGTLVAVVLSFIGNFIAPIYVEPLFNTYKPLTDTKIRDSILAMAQANQIPVTQVFEVDASRQTTRVSANVAGMLGTTRIALNDNLLKQCTLPEIRAVMAHEMGHYVLNHGPKLTIYFGIIALFGFGIARIFFDWALRRWGERWQIRDIADPAGVPLLALIFVTFTFLLTPVLNSIVRTTEREADQFGINTSREPDGAAKVALRLGAYRKLDPSPLEEFIFFDHPSGRARIRMGMEWKAAHLPAGNLDAPEPATD